MLPAHEQPGEMSSALSRSSREYAPEVFAYDDSSLMKILLQPQSRVRSFALGGMTLLAYAGGGALWWNGFGTGALMGVSLIVAVLLVSRRLSPPLAIAYVVIWSYFTWFLVPMVLRVVPLTSSQSEAALLVSTAAPILVGGVLLKCVDDKGAGQQAVAARTSVAELWSMMSGGLLLLAFAALALLRNGFGGIAWVMSGDARNHVVATSQVFPQGFSGMGLTTDPTSAFFGLMTTAAVRSPGMPESSVAHVHVMLAGLFAVTLAGAMLTAIANGALLMQFVARLRNRSAVPVLAASLASTSGIGIGVGLLDGFTTAIAVIPLLTLALVIGIGDCQRARAGASSMSGVLALGAGLLVVTFMWSYAAVAIVGIIIAVVWCQWRLWSPLWRAINIAVAALTLLVGARLLPPWVSTVMGNNGLGLPGSIVSPTPYWAVIAPAVVLCTVLVVRDRWLSSAIKPYLAATCAFVVLLAFMVYQPPGPPQWFYYAAKLTWVWSSATLGLLLLPLCVVASRLRKRTVRAATGVLIGTLLVLLLVRIVSPTDSPVLSFDPISRDIHSNIVDGWNAPNSTSVNVLMKALGASKPVVVSGVVDPGNDRLTNFWLEADPSTREANLADDFRGWAYYEAGDMASLCTLLVRNPSRIVITRDALLETSIQRDCKVPRPDVVLLP